MKEKVQQQNNNNTKIDNQQVFEYLTNTTPQNTTTEHNHKNQPQTHDTIQDLKFGMYPLVVSFKAQPNWQSYKTQPPLPDWK